MTPSESETTPDESGGNMPSRVAWFRNLGLGLFVHWSVDSQLGPVISHSMVGASDAYLDRYIQELPKTFNPTAFDPAEWARLAKVAGVRYVVFTTKHHNGFAMWDTDTTPFNVTNTPYGTDILDEIVTAFRQQDIAVGFYFSPDDFWFLYQQGIEISRDREDAQPSNNPELMAHNKTQLRELLTNYGAVDILFIDGEPTGIRELAWELQSDVVITRGAMETPEQSLREEQSDDPWEACLTLGTQWNYKASNETYMSAGELIETFIETRAKGGNLLVNVGPGPDGSIPPEQEARLRTLGLWNLVNREAVFDINSSPVVNEQSVWFTRSATDPRTIYTILTGKKWPKDPTPRTIELSSVRATDATTVGILGQSGAVFEYDAELDPVTEWTQTEERLYLTLTHTQRIYNADGATVYANEVAPATWPYPVVIEITDADFRTERADE